MKTLPSSGIAAVLLSMTPGVALICAENPAPAPVEKSAAATPASTVPLAQLPDDLCLLVRLVDGTRRDARWTASPYPALLSTVWGTSLRDTLQKQPGPFQLLAQLTPAQTASLGLTISEEQPIGHLLATTADAAQATAMATVLQARPAAPVATVATAEGSAVRATIPMTTARLEGLFRPRAPGFNRGLNWSWDELLTLTAETIATPLAKSSDAGLCWSSKAPWPNAPAETSLTLSAEWTVTPYGVHEIVQIRGLPEVSAGDKSAADKSPASADRTVFAGLPADTIWALATAPLPAVLAQVPGLDASTMTTWARKQGLPNWDVIAPQLGGGLLWLQQSAPLPAISLMVHMPKELGTAALEWLDAKHEFSPGTDGVHLGAIGFIPLQAAWRDGDLIITTVSSGIAGACARPGGFTTDPGIAEALVALPTGKLLLAGVSRSGESWGSLAAFAPWLSRRKPELASLGADLRKAGKLGFFSLRRDGPLMVIDAGGLFGGPLSTTAITGGFFRATLGDRPPRQRRGGQPEPEAAPNPPRQVEF